MENMNEEIMGTTNNFDVVPTEDLYPVVEEKRSGFAPIALLGAGIVAGVAGMKLLNKLTEKKRKEELFKMMAEYEAQKAAEVEKESQEEKDDEESSKK